MCPRQQQPPRDMWNEGGQSRSWCQQSLTVPPSQASGSTSPSSGHDPVSSSQTRRQRGNQHVDGLPHPIQAPFPWELPGQCLWAPCFVPPPCYPPTHGRGFNGCWEEIPGTLGLTGFPCTHHPTLSAELPGSLAEVTGIVTPPWAHTGLSLLKARAGPL